MPEVQFDLGVIMFQPANVNDVTLIITTHLENLPTILHNGGVCCQNGRGAEYKEIFSTEIVGRRARLLVNADENLTLGGCVALMMTPKTPAGFAVATGYGISRVPNSDLIHIETSVGAVTDRLVGVADRNPLARDARIIAGTLGFDHVDWEVIVSGNFAKTVKDPTRPTRVAAEVLIRDPLPISAVQRIVCCNIAVALTVTDMLRNAEVNIPVEVRPKAFFSAGM